MKIGYVLSGGAVRSIAHIGAIKALQEMGIQPNVMSASSGGALFGIGIAAGFSPDETLKIVLKVGSMKWFYPSRKPGGLFSLSRISDNLYKELPVKKFDELEIPLIVAATDFLNGETVFITEGEIIPAIMASCSYPGIFEPIEIDGRTFLDGGITNNFPVEPLLGDCDKIIGMSGGRGSVIDKVPNLQQTMIRSLSLAITQHDLNRFDKCDVLIQPKNLYQFGMFDGAKGQEIFDIGYKHTISVASEIEAIFK